jgi:deoxyribodipyrimidine photo-lyase
MGSNMSGAKGVSELLSIVWFRLDLRLADNPALLAGLTRGAVLPVFIWEPEEESPWQPGAASQWWLHQSLTAISKSLEELGSRLIIRRGPTLEALSKLATETGASAVFWNRRYEPAVIARDRSVKESLRAAGLEATSFNGALLFEPWTVQNQIGKPYQVFTPFWKHCLKAQSANLPLKPPRKIDGPQRWPSSLIISELELEPKINWAAGLRAAWNPGEKGAQTQLKTFLSRALADYGEARDCPDIAGTSRLSPHLHFGEISARQIWHELDRWAPEAKPGLRQSESTKRFRTELGWREFAHHLLFHFPGTPLEPLRPEFRKFPWNKSPERLARWQRGRTGYPIVDAGMRQLWATGWMHNRVRMVVASFLVKDLLLSWVEGARWFWDTLVDADLAQNTLGWQWSAGCGADAAPFFRIFNPVSQGEKFDSKGDYVRHWCPELSDVPHEWVHRPWQAPIELVPLAEVQYKDGYPEPIVKHELARDTALRAFHLLRKD